MSDALAYIPKFTGNNVPTKMSQQSSTAQNKGGFGGGLKYLGTSLGAGIVGIGEGIYDYVVGGLAKAAGNDDYAKHLMENNVAGRIQQKAVDEYNPNKAWQFAGDIASGIGQSTVGALVSAALVAIAPVTGGSSLALAGAAAGATIGLGAAGQSTAEAYQKTGALGGKEFLYGTASGLVEGGLEGLTGAAGKVGAKMAKQTARSMAKSITREGIVKGIIKDASGEFVEESLSEIIQPLLLRSTGVDKNAENATANEVLYAGLVGFFSGALMSGTTSAATSTSNLKRGSKAMQNGTVNTILSEAAEINSYVEQTENVKLIAPAFKDMSASLKAYNATADKTSAKAKMYLGEVQRGVARVQSAKLVSSAKDAIMANPQPIVEWYANKGIAVTAEDIATDKEGFATRVAINDVVSKILLPDLTSRTLDTYIDKANKEYRKNGVLTEDTNSALVDSYRQLERLDTDASGGKMEDGDYTFASDHIVTQDELQRFSDGRDYMRTKGLLAENYESETDMNRQNIAIRSAISTGKTSVAEIKAIKDLSRRAGVKVRFENLSDKDGSVINGSYADDTITINVRGADAFSRTAVHEYIHHISENAKAQYAKVKAAIEAVCKDNSSLQKVYDDAIAQYKDNQTGKTEDFYAEEAVCKVAERFVSEYGKGEQGKIDLSKVGKTHIRSLREFFSAIKERIKKYSVKKSNDSMTNVIKVLDEILSQKGIDKTENGVNIIKTGGHNDANFSVRNDFARLQEENRRISNAEIQLYHSGGKQITDGIRGRLASIFERRLVSECGGLRDGNASSLTNEKTGKSLVVYKDVSAKSFHDIFEIVHKYLPNGDAVDVHSVTDYNDAKCYLTQNGLGGFAITKNGDLISVFNLGEKGFLKTIKEYAFENGARTLDCYQSEKQPLADIYAATLGFKSASALEFNYDILAADKGKAYADYFVKTYGEAPVHFMVFTDSEVETRRFAKDQYDEAVKYQQSFTEKKAEKSASNEPKYSIVTTKNGKQYINADRQVITGNDYKEWKKQIVAYINEVIRKGQDIKIKTVEGDTLTITENTAGKAAYWNEGLNKQSFATKLRMEAHIDELAAVSRVQKNKDGTKRIHPDTKQHYDKWGFAKDGWSYRTAYFKDFDGKYYKIYMSIAEDGTVESIYNVGAFVNQKKKVSTSGTSAILSSTARADTSNNNYAQNSENVNTQSENTSNSRKSIAGQMSATLDEARRDEAIGMMIDGKSAQEIYDATGFYKGADGYMRYQIDDHSMKLRKKIGLDAKQSISERIKRGQEYVASLNQMREIYANQLKQYQDDINTYSKDNAKAAVLEWAKAQKRQCKKTLDYYEKEIARTQTEVAAAIEDGSKTVSLDESGVERIFDVGGIAGFPVRTTLGELITHEDLFKAYPQLKDVQCIFKKDGSGEAATGVSTDMYGNKSFTIYLYKGAFYESGKFSAEAFNGTLIHEIQHCIQRIEDFSTGTSVEAAKEQLIQEAIADYNSNPDKYSQIADNAKDFADVMVDDFAAYERYIDTYGEQEARYSELMYRLPKGAFKSAIPFTGDEDSVFAEGWRNEKNEQKYSLSSYTEKEISNYANSTKILVAGKMEDIIDFIQKARDGVLNGKKLLIGKIDAKTSSAIEKATSIVLQGYNVELRADDIMHQFNNHGDALIEENRGQRALSISDIASLATIITSFDNVSVGEKPNSLVFTKTINGKIVAVTYYAVGNKSLSLKTMYVYSGTKNSTLAPTPVAKATDFTSETVESTDATSIDNYAHKFENVNTQNKKLSLSEDKVLLEMPTKEKSTRLADVKEKGKDLKTSFLNTWVNAQAGVEKYCRQMGIRDIDVTTNYARSASAAANYMIQEELRPVFESVKKGRKYDKQYATNFMAYLLHCHNTDRMAEGIEKPVFGVDVGVDESKAAIAEYDKVHPEFKTMAEKVWAYSQKLLTMELNGGLISQELYDKLTNTYPHYVPTYRDTKGAQTVGAVKGKGFVEINRSVKRATGSDLEILPIDVMLARRTMQVYKAVRVNKVAAQLKAAGETDANMSRVQILESKPVTETVDYDAYRPKNNQITFFENGNAVTLAVS